MPSITIDGKVVEVPEGTTILGAAMRAGVRIPTLCHLRGVAPLASCRVCSVEVEGEQALRPACSTPVSDGMVIAADSRRVASYRQIALELIVAGLEPGALGRMAKDTQFRRLCAQYGVTQDGEAAPVAPAQEDPAEGNPFLQYDHNLCIRCQRCVGACNALARNHALQSGRRGTRLTIEAPFGEGWRASECESCGNCAQACPTGALVERRAKSYEAGEVSRTRTTCPHCAVGCQLDLIVRDGRIVDAEPAYGPSNKGMLCVKGRSASFDFVDSPERLTSPLIREPQTGGFRRASWDEALDLVARRFGELRGEHGGSALAAFACSRSTNEDIYLLQKMARTSFKTNNIDNCARV